MKLLFKFLKNKIFFIIIFSLLVLFFTNDFGLIDIEKTAIFTAVAIDKEDDLYKVSAQIALPEEKESKKEDKKSIISGSGNTVGNAIKNIGDVSGWFPKLSFCNLIIIGSDLKNENVVNILDYFAKSQRIQDSALVVMAEKNASDILKSASPLDSISSFAIQKIILKDSGFDKDIATVNVKTFITDYYSPSSSCYMPIVKSIPVENESMGGQKSGGGQQNEQQSKEENKTALFDATTTALFKNGLYVGEIDKDLSFSYNLLFNNVEQTVIAVNDVDDINYLLTVLKCKTKYSLSADEYGLYGKIDINAYCKISDANAPNIDNADQTEYTIPVSVKEKAQKTIKERVEMLILKAKETGCDVMKINEKLYRHNYRYYNKYKDDYLSKTNFTISVNVFN
ncbi:MAG: hypothetical protein IJR66_01925 [Clostridia bacterium]|nr:hypothetical protein [Clostridia bacterium]